MPLKKSLGIFFRNTIPFAVGFVVFCLVLVVIYIMQNQYVVHDVTVVGRSQYVHGLIGIEELKNKSMLTLSEEDEKKDLKNNNPYIKDVVITKKYPREVLIKVSFESPTAYLKLKDGFYLLAEDGKILEKSKEKSKTKIPEIMYYQQIPYQSNQSGQILVFQDLRDSLYFLNKLHELHENVISIDIQSFHMLGLYTSDTKYFFSSEKDRSIQEYMLKQAYKQLKITGKHYKTLDMRFDKPVVTF